MDRKTVRMFEKWVPGLMTLKQVPVGEEEVVVPVGVEELVVPVGVEEELLRAGDDVLDQVADCQLGVLGSSLQELPDVTPRLHPNA
jgi:hypothetical protein